MDKYLLPYLLLMAHMLSGAIWLIRINRRLDHSESRRQWAKYLTFLILVNLIWFCLMYSRPVFIFLCILVTLTGMFEWWKAVNKLRQPWWSILLFLFILAGFWGFLFLEQSLLLYAWFVVVIFDGSCQIAGQLIGKRKLLPRISPNKTLEGLALGAVITLATVFLVRSSFSYSWLDLILLALLIMAAAFLGDLLASLVKRKAGLDNFGRILPGHGGVLDRFDSLIMTGAILYLASLLKALTG